MKLGEKIALCRQKAGLSQEELAARLNLSRQAVSRWETGAAAPDLEKVAELSKLFGVTTDYLLLEDREEPEPSSLPGEERRSEPAFDPVAERRRKFRIGFGVAAVILGLLTAVAALALTQQYAETLTEWWTDLGRFGTALQSWRGGLLAFGIVLFLTGGTVLLREYFRKD